MRTHVIVNNRVWTREELAKATAQSLDAWREDIQRATALKRERRLILRQVRDAFEQPETFEPGDVVKWDQREDVFLVLAPNTVRIQDRAIGGGIVHITNGTRIFRVQGKDLERVGSVIAPTNRAEQARAADAYKQPMAPAVMEAQRDLGAACGVSSRDPYPNAPNAGQCTSDPTAKPLHSQYRV